MRRGWKTTAWAREVGGLLATVEAGSTQWFWYLYDLQQGKMLANGIEDELSPAVDRADDALERELSGLTRHKILLEAANADCREVQS